MIKNLQWHIEEHAIRYGKQNLTDSDMRYLESLLSTEPLLDAIPYVSALMSNSEDTIYQLNNRIEALNNRIEALESTQ